MVTSTLYRAFIPSMYVYIYIYITGDNSSVGIECAYIEDNLLGMLALITMFGIRGDTINNNKDMIDMMGI